MTSNGNESVYDFFEKCWMLERIGSGGLRGWGIGWDAFAKASPNDDMCNVCQRHILCVIWFNSTSLRLTVHVCVCDCGENAIYSLLHISHSFIFYLILQQSVVLCFFHLSLNCIWCANQRCTGGCSQSWIKCGINSLFQLWLFSLLSGLDAPNHLLGTSKWLWLSHKICDMQIS